MVCRLKNVINVSEFYFYHPLSIKSSINSSFSLKKKSRKMKYIAKLPTEKC